MRKAASVRSQYIPYFIERSNVFRVLAIFFNVIYKIMHEQLQPIYDIRVSILERVGID